MLMQGAPAHSCKCEALSHCIQDSGLFEIVGPKCQSCVIEEFNLDLTTHDVVQVGGQKHYQCGVEACAWAFW